ncbi:MAG: DUF433 domain-containing protein [Candidatus Sericytochromatia bacterium]|nr:DUF433 domain-containing protein [Candidatus Sericytochromatia bacterium]
MTDRRYNPIYSIPEVAAYLHIQPATLRSWVLGRSYKTRAGEKRFSEPLILIADSKTKTMSFINLIEAHVLSAIRKAHNVPMHNIRPALQHLSEKYGVNHPLAEYDLLTDGLDIFINECNSLISVNRQGQIALRPILTGYLSRITRDDKGIPARLFPFPTPGMAEIQANEKENLFVIDFSVAFGRRLVNGTGVPVDEIIDRVEAGESLDSIAEDFEIDKKKLEAVISAA